MGRCALARDALAVCRYELASRSSPFAGVSRQEIMHKMTRTFDFSQKRFERKGETRAEQLEDWLEDNPLTARRPTLDCIEPDCPPMLIATMQRCWADAPESRPTFNTVVHEFARGLPQHNMFLAGLVAKIAERGLGEERIKLAAALAAKRYAAVSDILAAHTAASAPGASAACEEGGAAAFVPLSERTGSLLLQICCEHFQGYQDTADAQ